RRSKRKAEQHFEAVAALLDRIPSPLESLHDPDRLDRCLERLPARSREMIDSRYRDCSSSEAIGRKLGMTAEAVRIGLPRIRPALRDCLERRGAAGESA